MKRLGIDFDDIVGGFNRAFIPYMNQQLGTTVTYLTHTSFSLPDIYGITQAEALRYVRDFCHSEQHNQIQLEPGALAGLRLLKTCFELHLITNRCESLVDITQTWLIRNRVDVFVDHHFANVVSLVNHSKSRSKAQICRELGVVGLLEDALHNANAVAAAGIPVVMPWRPWNQTGKTHSLVKPASGWKTSWDQLKQLAV